MCGHAVTEKKKIVMKVFDLSVLELFGEAEDTKDFIECKTSGPPVSRSSLRKSVGKKSEGK